MVRARALAVIALAAAGCDLVFPPGTLAVDADTGADATPDANLTALCGPEPFDARRYSAAWQSIDQMPFANASSLCTVRGWELATIDNVAEADAVGTVFAGTDYWIGLKDIGGEIWRSTHGCDDPQAWDTGQPDFATEDCAGLDGSTHRLHSFPCDGSVSSPDSMLCEQPRPPTPACVTDAIRPFDPLNYRNVGMTATYANALTMCGTPGEHLVMIDSPDESVAVATLSGGIDYWIGATDAATEGVWVTETGCPGYLQWQATEPNNGNGSGEHCASGIGGGALNDVPCNGTKEVICETE